MKQHFTQNLLKWNEVSNKRIMPWKGEKDPYRIWLSEIILQQTRAEQGLTYYEKILNRFPSVIKLAEAEDEEMFKLWEGLGYYSRCKNLLFTAREIAWEFGGRFPTKYDEILKLKGVGGYTAAAIASFAYNLPYAVVDGNVLRVLSRYFGKDIPIDSLAGRKFFQTLAQQLLDRKKSSAYNQAIMDFGATVCKPQLADCQHCVMKEKCAAFRKGWVNKLPIKAKKLQRKSRWFYYFIFSKDGQHLVTRRSGKDIWQNLYEFHLYETTEAEEWDLKKLEQWLHQELNIKSFRLQSISTVYSQQLTHQNLKGQFIAIELEEIPEKLKHFQKISPSEITTLPFPKMINQHLKSEFLNGPVF